MEKKINKLSSEFYNELEQLMFIIDESSYPTIGYIFTEEKLMRQIGIVYYLYTRDTEGENKND